MGEATNEKNSGMPFDLHGDLEDAYDEAERDGRTEVTETLDTFGIWQERAKCNEAFLHKIWRAIQGDAEAQADVGRAFYWTDHDPKETREEYKWLDKPELAIYWYELAAEAGFGDAQVDLGCLYCPDLLPYSDLVNGRFARYWWEQAAAQKLPNGLLGLAHCLRCGKCCCCSHDVARAEALEAEAATIPPRPN